MDERTPKGDVAPLTLQRLLDTHQAVAVLPGVLYFATTGECLSSSSSPPSSSSSACAPPNNINVSSNNSSSSSSSSGDGASPTALLTEALRTFFLKENPCAPPPPSSASEKALEVPATSATVGEDAIFLAPRGTAPYVYRPFFADFGPLDVGCCVHFARRLRELLQTVVQIRATTLSSSGAKPPVGSCSHHRGHNNNNNSADLDARTFVAHNGSDSRNDVAAQGPSPQPLADTTPSHLTPTAATTTTTTTTTTTAAAAPLPVVICASLNAQERVNTACLVGAFCVLVLGWSTAVTWSRVFADVYPSFLTYRDASTGVSNYPLSLQDVWSGLEQAAQLGWVDVDTFDLAAYWEGKAKDFSWIVPRRFVAMSSPRDADPQRTAEVFAPRMRAMNVRLVVRLNDDLYNPAPLLRLGIRHVDLPYADGSTPNDATLLQFLQAVEEHFGEQVAPSSLRQWWSVPAVLGVTAHSSGGAARTQPSSAGSSRRVNKPASASPATARLARLQRNNSGGRRAESAKPSSSQQRQQQQQQYAACSLLHSGKFRGMPDTRTAIPPPPLTVGSPGHASHSAVTTGKEARTATAAGAAAPSELGAVAVHCLAGLGRTGTMIAVYMMRHYGFTARGVIGYLRLCRPGSITGVQQQYLDTIERRLRPSPYVFATQRLKDFVQTLHETTTATTANFAAAPCSTSSPSAPSAAATSTTTGTAGDARARASAGLASGSDSDSGGGALPRSLNLMDVTGAAATATVAVPLSPLGGGVAGRLGHDTAATTPHTLSRADPVLQPATSAAGVAAFQIHGAVVGDARPSTGLGGALAQRRESQPWATDAPWGSRGASPQGLLLRRTPSPLQQQQQQQQRRRSSTSSLSFSTDHPDNTALDAVSSMPVLGGALSDRPRSLSGGHANVSNINGGGPVAAAATFSGGFFSDNLSSGPMNAATVRALPRAGDYKYASTYFVALERANRRSPQRNQAISNGSNVNNSSATSSAAASGRPPYNARSKSPLSATTTSASAAMSSAGGGGSGGTSSNNNNNANNVRAATASALGARRSSRLDNSRHPHPQQQQSAALPRFSVGSAGGANPLSRDASFGRNSSLPYQRRVSLMSITAYGAPGSASVAATGAATSGREGNAPLVSAPAASSTSASAASGGKWNASDEVSADAAFEQRPYTTSAIHPAGLGGTPERGSENSNHLNSGTITSGSARLRKTPLKPERPAAPAIRRRLSMRSSYSQAGYSWKEGLEDDDHDDGVDNLFPMLASTKAGGEGGQGRGGATTRLYFAGSPSSMGKATSPRPVAIPEAVLPMWGRPI